MFVPLNAMSNDNDRGAQWQGSFHLNDQARVIIPVYRQAAKAKR